jgi:hypothetical protein
MVAGFRNPPHPHKGGLRLIRKNSKCGLRIAAPSATLALDQEIGPVELDQTIRVYPGKRVKSVNVLRHDQENLAGFFQSNDGVVRGIRLRCAKAIPPLQLVIPVFDARRFRRHEILEVNRLAPSPDALRSAEIRDPARSRNARARKDQGLSRSAEVIGENGLGIIERHLCVTARSALALDDGAARGDGACIGIRARV